MIVVETDYKIACASKLVKIMGNVILFEYENSQDTQTSPFNCSSFDLLFHRVIAS